MQKCLWALVGLLLITGSLAAAEQTESESPAQEPTPRNEIPVQESAPRSESPAQEEAPKSESPVQESASKTIKLDNYIITMQGYEFSTDSTPFVFDGYDFDLWGFPDSLIFRNGLSEIAIAGDLDYETLTEIPKVDFSQGEAPVIKGDVYIVKCADGRYVKLQVLEIEMPSEEMLAKEEAFPTILFRWEYLK